MPTIHLASDIDAPRKRVFEMFTELDKAAERINAIESVEVLTDGPFGVGTRWRETRKMMGGKATEEMEIVACDPPNGYTAVATSHGIEYRATFAFTEPSEGRTRVELEFVSTPKTFFAVVMSPMAALMSGAMKKMMQQDLDDLKAAVERGG